MTRKEATQYFPTQTLINKIFDDFEKELLAIKDRVCEWVKNDEYEDGNVWGTDCKMDWHIPDNDTPKDHKSQTQYHRQGLKDGMAAGEDIVLNQAVAKQDEIRMIGA